MSGPGYVAYLFWSLGGMTFFLILFSFFKTFELLIFFLNDIILMGEWREELQTPIWWNECVAL